LRAKAAPRLSGNIRKNLIDLGFRQSEFEAKLSHWPNRAPWIRAVELIFLAESG